MSTYPRFDGTQACSGPPAAAAPAYAGALGANPKPAQALCRGDLVLAVPMSRVSS